MEIPSLLLQPFAENAVKHGIAMQPDKGIIRIHFAGKGKNLQLTVRDNGKGFDNQQQYTGLGLSLSKNRISLLNSIYGGHTISLDIQSHPQGTEVTVSLTQWL